MVNAIKSDFCCPRPCPSHFVKAVTKRESKATMPRWRPSEHGTRPVDLVAASSSFFLRGNTEKILVYTVHAE